MALQALIASIRPAIGPGFAAFALRTLAQWPVGADVEGFLDREQLRYAGQLELYARALGSESQLGLYFPMLNGWREWKSKVTKE